MTFLLGCSDGDPMRRSAGSSAATYELAPVVNPGGVRGRNYTPHYIGGFSFTGENGMRGAAPTSGVPTKKARVAEAPKCVAPVFPKSGNRA